MFTPFKPFPMWVWLSVATNGILSLTVLSLLVQQGGDRPATSHTTSQQSQETAARFIERSLASEPATEASPQASTLAGQRYRLNYEDWLLVLEQEAEAIARTSPSPLAVLAGDSITLWFPPELLPKDYTWLNQGISGEISGGLLRRLDLFEDTQPDVIFILIGINDLIRGLSDDTVVANYELILEELQETHPDAEIVMQSILPHGDRTATWEGKGRLMEIPNDRIRALNERLRAVATAANVRYLDIHPLFTDDRGALDPSLSTDGLHLNEKGYLIWRSALQLYAQLYLQPENVPEEL